MAKLYENDPRGYTIPFLWMHGEDDARLRELIAVIGQSGIGALCVESRPHPDFLGEKWWKDMDTVLDECKKRDMAVWILDDEKFPTGYAAGRAEGSEYRIRYLNEFHLDIAGPQKGASILVNPASARRDNREDRVISVVAARRIPGKNMDHSTYINLTPDPVEDLVDLTDTVRDGAAYFDVPEGLWRVFVLTARYGTGSERRDKYLNPLTRQGTKILLDTVYEAHYARYAADFGKTIKGFFSDEPQFGGGHGYHCAIGRAPNLMLPWSDEVLEKMSLALGGDARKYLPGLWCDIGEITPRVRFAYMDTVTRLYGENFCAQIGDWCRAHGVEYMGHVIEENNAHARLGAGTGHYFRALWGQDLAGIDIVLNGIIPGIKGGSHAQSAYQFEADDDFFYYCLAQMAASLAHIDSKKRGRAMCEIFGAYGWQEGLREMKWLADFMMSRGVNVFVPHAFTPKDFPDPDCPPHFYAMGENPQYRHFGLLMRYMNRVCDLISGGRALANAGVLYHAEAEWPGSDFTKTQEVVKRLAQAQIEADILPADAICEGNVQNGALVLGECAYRTLAVPYARLLPAETLLALGRLARAGVRVLFAGKAPEASSTTPVNVRDALLGCEVVPLENVAAALRDMNLCAARVSGFQPDLKLYPYEKGGRAHLILFNENTHREIDARVTLRASKRVYLYKPYENRLYRMEGLENGDEANVRVQPYELCALILTDEALDAQTLPEALAREIPVTFTGASVANAKQYPKFVKDARVTGPGNLNRPEGLPRFSGTVRYEAEFAARAGEALWLDLGEVGESAEVFVNGASAGVRICPPYGFCLTGLAGEGVNRLTIEVTNTLVYQMHDAFSALHAIGPSGLVGPVRLTGKE